MLLHKRRDKNNFPAEGFLNDQAISLDDCLRGMTVWPAMASFQEDNNGCLEPGKDATFVILDKQILVIDKFEENFSLMTMIKGKRY